MRKAINENPIAQIGLIAALGVLIAFLLLTRMGGGAGEESSAAPEESATSTTPAETPSAAPEAPAGDAVTPAAPAPTAGFEAGPGLPGPVVNAYEDGDTVVLLVTRQAGIDDKFLRGLVQRLRARKEVALFTTPARHISRYARVTEGVNVNRVPAMVVIRPKRLNEEELPVASVSYGFRGDESVAQAVRDALYKGPTNLPFYPR